MPCIHLMKMKREAFNTTCALDFFDKLNFPRLVKVTFIRFPVVANLVTRLFTYHQVYTIYFHTIIFYTLSLFFYSLIEMCNSLQQTNYERLLAFRDASILPEICVLRSCCNRTFKIICSHFAKWTLFSYLGCVVMKER